MTEKHQFKRLAGNRIIAEYFGDEPAEETIIRALCAIADQLERIANHVAGYK